MRPLMGRNLLTKIEPLEERKSPHALHALKECIVYQTFEKPTNTSNERKKTCLVDVTPSVQGAQSRAA